MSYYPLGHRLNPLKNIDVAFDAIRELEEYSLKGDERLCHIKKSSIYIDSNFNPLPSWDWPDTAFHCNDLPSDTFIATRQESGMFSFKPNLSHRKFLFRGQTLDYKECVPTMFRDKQKHYYLDEMIMTHEMSCLIQSHPLVQLLGLYGVELPGLKFKMFTNYGGISQHYSNKTSFLDLTSSIDVAKFFAVTSYNKRTKKYEPFQREGVGVIYLYELFGVNDFFHHKDMFFTHHHLSTIGKQIFPRSGKQFGFLMDLGPHINFDTLNGIRKIYFKHDKRIAKRICKEAGYGSKYMPISPLDLYWEEKMSHPRKRRQISSAAVNLNLKYNPEETWSTITEKLRKRGFEITSSQPYFNEEQLDMYYTDIKNGWWEDEFTKDIYFYGKEGQVLTDAFRRIRTNQDYRRFFYKDRKIPF